MPRTQRSAQPLRNGALQSRGPGYLLLEETGVPVLRSGMKNAASRLGHEINDSNFKQPHLRVHAAQSVRGLPVPRELREGMERWEAPGVLR